MSDEQSLMAHKFRSFAGIFRQFAEKGLARLADGASVEPSQFTRYMGVQDEAGSLIVTAFRRGYLSGIPGLAELVESYDNPAPQTGKCQLVPCPSNLFMEFCGNHKILAMNTCTGFVTPPGSKTMGGVMPSAFPAVLPGEPVDNMTWEAQHEHYAVACEFLADRVVAVDMKPTGTSTEWHHSPDEPKPDHFPYGPLSGNAESLDLWIGGKGKKHTRLQAKGKNGSIWVVKRGRYAFEVWFQNQREYDTAKRKSADPQ